MVVGYFPDRIACFDRIGATGSAFGRTCWFLGDELLPRMDGLIVNLIPVQEFLHGDLVVVGNSSSLSSCVESLKTDNMEQIYKLIILSYRILS